MDAAITGQKVKELRQYLGLKQAEFSQILGLSSGVADIERSKVKLPGFVLKELYKKYDVNPLWLYGESKEMFLKKDHTPSVIAVNEIGDERILTIPYKASAGYAGNIGDEKYYDELKSFNLPWLDTRNKTFRAFQVQGDSMYPTFKEGDWVITEFVNDWNTVKNNEIAVVVDVEGLRIKRCFPKVKVWELVSDNQVYPIQEVKAPEIKEVWKFKALITQELPKGNNLLQEVYSEVLKIKAKL